MVADSVLPSMSIDNVPLIVSMSARAVPPGGLMPRSQAPTLTIG